MHLRWITCVFLFLPLLGCTGSSDTPSINPTEIARTIDAPLPETMSAKPSAVPSTKRPAKCTIRARETRLLIRDWDRVVNAIGREDQAVYTKALAKNLKNLEKPAQKCPATESFVEMQAVASEIDRSARDGNPDLVAINQFRVVGNSWLESLGRSPSLLS